MEEREEQIDRLKRRTEAMTSQYKINRIELAHLKRQIERESNKPFQSATEPDPVSLNRRMDALEHKVDQILQKLWKEPD